MRVIELASIGPASFCGMMLADLGADVVRIDRVETAGDHWTRSPVLDRGRRSVAINLKRREGLAAALHLVEQADVLLEGFRPGVTERLGVGPEECLARNPRLVYARMTGWGQTGPYAHTAGHDIDYIALAGALHAIGPADGPPVPPLNLVGDFGGGGMLLAFGIVCALLHVGRTGTGQVVDAAVVDGTATLTGMIHGFLAEGRWRDERGANLLDSGAPFYDTYRCADGRHVAVGALEERFFRELLERLGLSDDPAFAGDHLDPRGWPGMRLRLAEVFGTRTRDEWRDMLSGTDACVAPVLSLSEAPRDPHNRAREVFVEIGGALQPAPAPRFSAAPTRRPRPAPRPGEHTVEVLREAGLTEEEIAAITARTATSR